MFDTDVSFKGKFSHLYDIITIKKVLGQALTNFP